jgi:ribonuclease R
MKKNNETPPPLLTGKISAHRDGYGFFVPNDGSEDLFIHSTEMRKVFDGDEVTARILRKDKRGKIEGEIVSVVAHNTRRVTGKLFREAKQWRVIPSNPKMQHTVFIEQPFTINANHEDIVVVEITRQPDRYRPPAGIITEVLGQEMAPGMEIEIAIRNFGIPFEWPVQVEQEAGKLAPEPTTRDKANRIDIRHLPLVTIDGEDARDFDDAVFCQKKPKGGWKLWVAIADVSHYVQIGSALDNEGKLRATSVYFPQQVVPMLPEQLSNGLCSLKPAVDRLCMVCEMSISAAGKVTGYQFYEGVMHSHARLTYTEVGRILAERDDPESLVRASHAELVPHLDELHRLFKRLRAEREKRGAIDFDTVETRFIFDEQRKIESIVPVVRNDAHMLIEECMLCANVAASSFLEKHNIPALYRSHEGPTESKLANLREFIGELGLTLGGGESPTPLDYQRLSLQIRSREDANLIQTMMLRSMSQAIYEPDNKGHFGLAYEAYTHFTSPIRRYPDLLTHRAIKSVIRSEMPSKHVQRAEGQKNLPRKKIYPYAMTDLVILGEHCSMAERRADEATRDVSNWLKCEYLQEHLGDTFTGNITSVAPFGFFVELDNLYSEGMVHISQLGSDYFVFDAGKQRLVGERTRTIFRTGDRITVTISRIDLAQRRIELQLANPVAGNRKDRSRSSRKKKR